MDTDMVTTIGLYYDLPPHISAFITVRGVYERIRLKLHVPAKLDTNRIRLLHTSSHSMVTDVDVIHDRETTGVHADIEVWGPDGTVEVTTPNGAHTLATCTLERISVLPI